MTFTDLVALAGSHKWVAVASVLIGLAIRYLKEDVPGTWTIPARCRPWLALGLGLAAAVVDRIAAGTPWADALVSGIVAGAGSSVSHDLFIEGLRGGRELRVPGAAPLLPAMENTDPQTPDAKRASRTDL